MAWALRVGCVGILLAGALWGKEGLERLVYMVDRSDSLSLLQERIDSIEVVAPQVFSFTLEGTVYGEVDPRIIALAKERGKKLMPLVMNENFEKEKIKAFLANPKAQERLIGSLIKIALKEGFGGWQLDFEHLGITSKEAYTQLVRQLYARLKEHHLSLSIAVVPPRGEEPKNAYGAKVFEDWVSPYDLKALAEHSDFLTLMAYDQHTGGSTPGPIASRAWVEGIIQEALIWVPKEKLSLGIPLYSRLWHAGIKEEKTRGVAKSLTFAGAMDWLERQGAETLWLERDGVKWAMGERGGVKEYLFMEEARSLALKVELAKRYGLRGISLWRLGQEDPRIWDEL
ncbi:glycosyl hydrolase family 18 protein [Wolinella succinogenes]|uniref:glycosyl hydrolase family 18 protein n=1 Tax=Wolinella succinogenes TaxID=844 RepID=UPI002FCB3F6C